MDEGLDHAASNRAAARFMRMAFGCDTSTPTTHRQSSRRLLLDDENYAYIDDAGIRWVYKFRPGERQAMLDAGMFDATTKA